MDRYVQEPIPNVLEAKDYVFRSLRAPDEYHFYNKYVPQIISTNELRQIYELKNHVTPGSRVLTVSASGEQPLFFKQYGAEYVLTFDISYNSYLLTSLKIAALQTFTKRWDYEKFVRSLIDHCKPQQLMSTPGMDKVFRNLSDVQKNHISVMDRICIPVFVDDIKCQIPYIGQDDYDKLRASVKSPFPFIWTDITELDKKLGDEKFDFVYYSNILGFIHPHKVRQVMEKTKNYVNAGGKIFLVEDVHMDLIKSATDDVYKAPDWDVQILPSPQNTGFNQFVIQRVQFTKQK